LKHLFLVERLKSFSKLNFTSDIVESLPGRSGNTKLNLDFGSLASAGAQRPEIHSLARLEGDLALAIGYCVQCQTLYESSGRIAKLMGNAGHLGSKNRAIEYAGMTLRDARNYEINGPTSDSVFAIYRFFRPLIMSVAAKAGPYRDEAKLRSLLSTPIDMKIADCQEKIAYSEKFYSKSHLEDERVKEMKDEVARLEQLKKNNLFTALFTETGNEFMRFVREKGQNYVSSLIKDTKRQDIINHLQKARAAFDETGPAPWIGTGANDFVCYCSGISKPAEQCSHYRIKLELAKKALGTSIDKRQKTYKELKSGIGCLFDVPIGVLSIMSDEEFDVVKALGLAAVVKQIS
jgi:hypothetical protein